MWCTAHADAVNPERTGTKVAADHVARDRAPALAPRSGCGSPGRPAPRLRRGSAQKAPLGSDFDSVLDERRKEADQFYATVIPAALTADEAMVMRQALAGLLWGKQYYEYNVHRWVREHGISPWAPRAAASRSATCRGFT